MPKCLHHCRPLLECCFDHLSKLNHPPGMCNGARALRTFLLYASPQAGIESIMMFPPSHAITPCHEIVSCRLGHASRDDGPSSGSATPQCHFFLVDDLGWSDLGCYGSRFHETPHMDQLAREGVRFDQAYATCHVCSPSRASILTGKYPARLDLTEWLGGAPKGHSKPCTALKSRPHCLKGEDPGRDLEGTWLCHCQLR